MDSDTKRTKGIFKTLVIVVIIIGVMAFVLNIYNRYSINKAINAAVSAVEVVFNGKAEYSKGSDRIIVEIYNLEDEKELFDLTKEALPLLSSIGEYDIVTLLSTRAYYKGNKNNFQFYDIRFKDIDRIEWDKTNNFDDFLTYLNVRLN